MHTLTERLLNDVLDRLEEEVIRLRDSLHCEHEEPVRLALANEILLIIDDMETLKETFGL